MSFSSRQAFLRAILASPDDDGPRLIYADWLEEHGDPRAEFIRLQIAEAAEHDAELRQRARRRALMILQEHEDEWIGPLRPFVRRWTFHRGFLDWIDVSTVQLLAYAEHIWDREPVIAVHLHAVANHASAVAELPELKYIRRLCLGLNEIGDEGFVPLVTSRYLVHLRSLSAWHCSLGDASASAVANAPNLAPLRTLDLSHNRILSAGAIALARSPFLQHLQRLRLYRNPYGVEAKREIKDRFGPAILLR